LFIEGREGWEDLDGDAFQLKLTPQLIQLMHAMAGEQKSDISNFYLPLKEGIKVSLFCGAKIQCAKPVVPYTVDKSVDPYSDGSGIVHMAKRALFHEIPSNKASLGRFLAEHFANNAGELAPMVEREMYQEMSGLPPQPPTVSKPQLSQPSIMPSDTGVQESQEGMPQQQHTSSKNIVPSPDTSEEEFLVEEKQVDIPSDATQQWMMVVNERCQQMNNTSASENGVVEL